MATATLSYSNLQQHDQTWSAETGLLSPKSPEPSAPKWGQTDSTSPSFQPSNEANNATVVKTNVPISADSQENSDSDEMAYSQDEKNREVRECLKNIQTSDDPDKAYWNYFKTILEQEGHEKAQAAYLEYIKNERLVTCIQAYKAQAEAKYQWSERQRMKEEQLNHYKQLINMEEAVSQNRNNQQTLSEIDYFKSKWESYALPANAAISPDMYKDDIIKNQENLLQKNGNYVQYNNLTQDMQQQVGVAHGNVQDILDIDAANYYLNSGLQDPKQNAQYIAQHLAQKMAQPAMKRIIGNKGDSNTLDDIMADFQANGRDSTAPPSPRASRGWGTTVPATTTTSPISVRPTLRQMIFPHANNAVGFGNIAPNVATPGVVNSLATSLPRTEAELIRQLNSLIGATSAQLQKQQQLYPSQAQYGLQLGGLTDSQFRRRRSTVTSTECAFCRNNGEQPAVYRGHILKDAEGRVRCPILRDYTCRNCGATGDAAHTVKYCPLTPKTDLSFTQLQKNLRMANGKRRGSQETTLWTTCDIP